MSAGGVSFGAVSLVFKADSSGYPEIVHFSKDVGQAQARENAPVTTWNLTVEKPSPFEQAQIFTGRDLTFKLRVSMKTLHYSIVS